VGQDDPYEILGIPRDARLEEIERAFRRLAKLYHPDKRGGDLRAEETFRKITAAYSDVRKVAQEVSEGMPPPRPEPEPAPPPQSGPAPDSFGFEPRERPRGEPDPGEFYKPSRDAIGDPLRQAFIHDPLPEEPAPARQEVAPITKRTIRISFLEAAQGVSRPLQIRRGIPVFGRHVRTLDVKIPPGIADGTVLRLRGAGFPGRRGGPSGDLLLKVSVDPEPGLRRNGADVHSEVQIPLSIAILGGRVAVQTTLGRAVVNVPPRSEPGAVIRLRGAGMMRPDGERGDHIVRVQVRMPKHITREQARLLRELEAQEGVSYVRPGFLRRLWPFRRRSRA